MEIEELQAWWEVPTIAHFCHTFQAAFNLFPFEIEELEAALLENNADQDIHPCASVEQLLMRLLQGCCENKTVNNENWKDVLHECLEVNGCQSYIPYFNQSFEMWPLRAKVQLLLTLCELRLDAEDVGDLTKNIVCDAMRVEPVGVDGANNVYWYFFGLRLYKEDPIRHKTFLGNRKKEGRNKLGNLKAATLVSGDYKRGENRARKGLRNILKTSEIASFSGWEVVCHTVEDWKALVKSLNRSRMPKNKDLGAIIENHFFGDLSNIARRREYVMKKRLVELAPRRVSARIDKVRQEREVGLAAMKEEKERKIEEDKKRREREAEDRKSEEIAMRAKRVSERHKAGEERAKRAKLRELRVNDSDYSDSLGSCHSNVISNGFEANFSDSEDESNEPTSDGNTSAAGEGSNSAESEASSDDADGSSEGSELDSEKEEPESNEDSSEESESEEDSEESAESNHSEMQTGLPLVQSHPSSGSANRTVQHNFATIPKAPGVYQQACVYHVQQGLANVQKIRNFRKIGGINFGAKQPSACFTYHKAFSVPSQVQIITKRPCEVSSFSPNVTQSLGAKLVYSPTVVKFDTSIGTQSSTPSA